MSYPPPPSVNNSWNTTVVEKLIAKVVEKFSTFYGVRGFNVVGNTDILGDATFSAYRFYKSPPLNSILRQIHPVSTFIANLLINKL
jgi:hypothetical protein